MKGDEFDNISKGGGRGWGKGARPPSSHKAYGTARRTEGTSGPRDQTRKNIPPIMIYIYILINQHSKHPSFLSLRETLLVAPRAAPADPDAWS